MSARSTTIARVAQWDALFIALAALHGVALVTSPTIAVIALGMWWNSNTISHNFIHRPFFRARSLNLLFSAYSTLLLGVPQRLWRDRHLAHHAGIQWQPRLSTQLAGESLLVCALWIALAAVNPAFFATTYLPGFCIGLALCALQGHYEHMHGTTSHYGSIYNFLCFNDGYHVEHHASPGTHWTRLPGRVADAACSSRWPPLLRWLDNLAFAHSANVSNLVNRRNPTNLANRANPAAPSNLANPDALELLERLVLRSRLLQRFVLRCHRRAFAALIPQLPPLRRIAIVGGGLFPRTALILRELQPHSQIVIIDASASNLETARSQLGDSFELVRRRFVVSDNESTDFDLVVIPLSFQGDREAIYQHPPSSAVLVHDWIWRRWDQGHIISIALLKRLNLVRR